MFKQKNTLKQRDKIILINILFFILFFGVYYFIIRADLNELSDINQNINNNFNTLEILEKKGNDIKKFKQSLSLADTVLNKISEYFVRNEVEFVTIIEGTASNSGLTERLVMGESKADGKIKVVPITLYTQGTFKQQLKFINELSSLKYFFNIQSIDFSKVSSGGIGTSSDATVIDMTLNVNTYWQIDEK